MQFDVGDAVIWSSNKECQDVFHEHCIITWMCRKREGFQDCPCCRQVFVETSILKESIQDFDGR